MKLHRTFPLKHRMTRFPRFFLLLVIILGAGSSGFLSATEKTNPSVACAVTVREPKSGPGSTITLEVKLTPVQGVHINMTPPIDVRLDSNAVIGSAGALQFPKPTKDGYFDATRPFTLPITLARSAVRGKQTISGTVVYFFCSDKDGVCSRFKQKFEVSLTVSR